MLNITCSYTYNITLYKTKKHLFRCFLFSVIRKNPEEQNSHYQIDIYNDLRF